MRFAWWGSEELGLLGSRHYLEQLAGAGEVKSQRERQAFGGTAGQPADPCYHRRCDDLDNLDLTVLDQMAAAAAHAVATFARDPTPADRARG